MSKYRIQSPKSNKKHAPPPPQPMPRKQLAEPDYLDFEPIYIDVNNKDDYQASYRNDNSFAISSTHSSESVIVQDHLYEIVKDRRRNGASVDSGFQDEKGGNHKTKGGKSVKQCGADDEAFNESVVGMYECPFKISSTEDNYMLDKFNSKTNGRNIIHQRSKSSEEHTGYSKNTKHSPGGSDFLSKHRKRIAKLKRRFLDSHVVTRPLSPKTYNKQQHAPYYLEFEVPSPENATYEQDKTKPETLEDQSVPETADETFVQERRRRYPADEMLSRSDFEAMRARWSTYGGEFAVVIAIDFGTTYSGYAYSFTHEPSTYLQHITFLFSECYKRDLNDSY